MKSIKCSKCALTNWSTSESCKRCGAPLTSENALAENYPSQSPYLPSDSRQAYDYASLPEEKEPSFMPLGILMIILGGILLGFFFMAPVKLPVYFLIMGSSLVASGFIFCMRQWVAVYVYLTGFAIAVAVMFMTEQVKQPLPRLAVPTLLGLGLINKLLKAKKSAALHYAGQ